MADLVAACIWGFETPKGEPLQEPIWEASRWTGRLQGLGEPFRDLARYWMEPIPG